MDSINHFGSKLAEGYWVLESSEEGWRVYHSWLQKVRWKKADLALVW